MTDNKISQNYKEEIRFLEIGLKVKIPFSYYAFITSKK